jgi:hypothetical protein
MALTYPTIEHGQVNAVVAGGAVNPSTSLGAYCKQLALAENPDLIDAQSVTKRTLTGDDFTIASALPSGNYSRLCDLIGCADDYTNPKEIVEYTRGLRVTGRIADYDTGLLFGELGWLMGRYAQLSKFDDDFLAIADLMESDPLSARQDILALLLEIGDGGYVVNWESCVPITSKPVVLRKQSRWLRFKIKLLQWLERL